MKALTCSVIRLIVLGLFLLCVVSVITACGNAGTGSGIDGDSSESSDSSPLLQGAHDERVPYENLKWMANIDDNKLLSEIMIPATHDTGADVHTSQQGAEWLPYVITQDFFFSNQLRLGVRWFDIRLRLISETLTVHHSDWYLHKTFDQLLVPALEFLKQNPTETLVFMIKPEGSLAANSHFGWHVYERLDHYGFRNFYLKNEVPTIGEARGKIVIVRQFKNEVSLVCTPNDWACIYQDWPYIQGGRPSHYKYDAHDFGMQFTWSDNTPGAYFPTGGINIYVQDHYHLSSLTYAQKEGEIFNCLVVANREQEPKQFFLNFTSCEYVPWLSLQEIAAYINPKVDELIATHSFKRGVIFINYAGGADKKNSSGLRDCAPNLVQTIIDQNFR